MKIAVIDLGTNTFNLLIAEIISGKPIIVFTDKAGVKLGKGGINNKIITPEAFQRALNGVAKHVESIKNYQVDKTFATATSGIRSTENGKQLVEQIKSQFKIDVQIISGDEEAELIYRGVKQIVEFKESYDLVLDIGGGSNEFILANKSGIIWKQSYNLGIARLLDKFNPSDPITLSEIIEVEDYIDSELKTLFQATNQYNTTRLIGSSGTFDSLRNLIIERKGLNNNEYKFQNSFVLELKDYFNLHNDLLKSTYNERLNLKGLEFVRVEMIVLASIFVNFIIRKLEIKSMIQSSYALKEGMLDKIITSNLL
jgi:exopolyphosphatase/guanosine-5'-triphosphate,3'-diphosphate pyrophosphatase